MISTWGPLLPIFCVCRGTGGGSLEPTHQCRKRALNAASKGVLPSVMLRTLVGTAKAFYQVRLWRALLGTEDRSCGPAPPYPFSASLIEQKTPPPRYCPTPKSVPAGVPT